MFFSITIFHPPSSSSYSELGSPIIGYRVSTHANETDLFSSSINDKDSKPQIKLSAGTDQVVKEDTIAYLKSTMEGKSHSNVKIYWQQISPKEPILTLERVSNEVQQFKAPNVGKTTMYVFSVTASDQEGNKYSDTVKVKVLHTKINTEKKQVPLTGEPRNSATKKIPPKEDNSVSRKNQKNLGVKSSIGDPLNRNEITSSANENNEGGTRQMGNQVFDTSKSKVESSIAPIESKLRKAVGNPINNQYIVVLKSNTPSGTISSLVSKSRTEGAQVPYVFDRVLRGFTIKVPEVKFLERISNRSDVAYIEPDLKVKMFEQTLPTGVNRIDGDLSQAKSGDGQGAVNTDIAILDTGISLNHPDLNVYKQVSFVPGVSSAADGNGHGSHVSGIAAAKDNTAGVVGLSPGARLWAVKVLDDNGQGSISSVIKGVEYVTDHATEIDAANISFGCTCQSDALATAIHNSVLAGVTYAVAAGNDGKDAAGTSPANHPDVITVSAITDSDGKCGGVGTTGSFGKDDYFASFSNYGSKIDIAAPGVNIYSTFKGSSYATESGTSMATPHVTGAAALYKSTHSNASPAEVKKALISSGSTKSTVCDNNGHGYFQGDPDSAAEPLLYLAASTSGGNPGSPSGSGESKYHYSPSLVLSGSNYYDQKSTLPLQLAKFSVAGWFKTSSNFVSTAFIVNKGGIGSDLSGRNLNYGIWMNSAGRIVAGYETLSGVDQFVTSSSSYKNGQWHYAVLTYDGSIIHLYIDGVNSTSKSSSSSPDKSGTHPLRVGANSFFLSNFFKGNVDEVRIWNRAVTATEVTNQFNAGSFNTNGQILYLPFG